MFRSFFSGLQLFFSTKWQDDHQCLSLSKFWQVNLGLLGGETNNLGGKINLHTSKPYLLLLWDKEEDEDEGPPWV
jgi:hypothetical protein